MGRHYERLDIETFGRQLITSGDLDPIYIAMDRVSWSSDAHRARWLIAYWCLYHAGAASYLSEKPGSSFWTFLMLAAENEAPAPAGGRWPRGHERRHWRGGQAVAACSALQTRYRDNPERMVDFIAQPQNNKVAAPFAEVANRVQTHRSFGPWISFKIGDMIDRLGIRTVNFENADVFMFKDPALAAKMLYAAKHGWNVQDVREGRLQVKDAVIPEVVQYLRGQFSDLLAPPRGDRPIDLQEVETVLCKWKSMLNGHYPPFNDIDEIRGGLELWSNVSLTARMMLEKMPASATPALRS